MAHTVHWPNKWYLYAIGNTPAVCFTNGLPPELPADILLLGCGDGRSVLYTVYADLCPSTRRLDFTCCDIEPAILARNVLLYTLLAELRTEGTDVTVSKIWSMYYHVFIDEETLNMLVGHCQRLADLSADVDTWKNGKYGSFIKFCDQRTLLELRRHWLLYVDMKKISRAEKDSLRNDFYSAGRFVNSGINLTSIRAAGPLWAEVMEVGGRHHKHYWTSGVTFTDADKIAAASHINPTFAYSLTGKGIALHYGSDPMLSFHLARALAPLEGEARKTIDISTLVESAVSEFTAWCRAFSHRLAQDPSSLVIRFFAGDCLSFCRALHYCGSSQSTGTPIYTKPWSIGLTTLDGGDYAVDSQPRAPLQFDVIDSSNLRDALGLMNILIAIRPLLRRSPSSAIYTDTINPSVGGDSPRNLFSDELYGEITTMTLLLDLCPVSYVSNFTTHSNVHETVATSIAKTAKQFYEHVVWKIGSLANSESVSLDKAAARRLKFEPTQLAALLHGIYLKMFSEENIAIYVARKDLRKLTLIHYVRASFVLLVQIIKDRVETDWEETMEFFYHIVTTDKSLMIGSNSYQDLFCALYAYGVYTLYQFLPDFSDTVANADDPIAAKGWVNIPPVVCISFKVPRKKLKHIEEPTAEQVGNPILVCNLISPTAHNFFQHIQTFFGDVKVESSGSHGGDPTITYEEDPQGVRGSSAVIFSFYVPTAIIRTNASKIQVALSLRNTPIVTHQLRQLLGPNLILFSVPLVDNKYVSITRGRPGNAGELEKLRSLSSEQSPCSDSAPVLDAPEVTLDRSYQGAVLLTRRTNIVSEETRGALADKAPVEVKQVSPQAIQVTFGSHQQMIPFPCPVDSTDMKTRIARKSSYVEVDVRPSRPLQKLGMTINPFPIIKNGDELSVWNIHYLNLERLPLLDLSATSKLAFVENHMIMSCSDRELRLSKSQNPYHPDWDQVLHVKQTLYQLFMQTCGLKAGLPPQRVYGLFDPGVDVLYCVILVNGVRLDLASHTLVLDACVLPRITRKVQDLLNTLGQFVRVTTQAIETKAWKQLIPALVERCRTWSHTENCEYRSRGGVPVSLDVAESPLCSCGIGRCLGPFETNKKWKNLVPYVTRAAISPLFAVPFVETVGDDFLSFEEGTTKKGGGCAKCGGSGRPKLLLCGKCRRVSYCSAECQRADWKSHKTQCKKE